MGKMTEDLNTIKKDINSQISEIIKKSNEFNKLYKTEWEPINVKDSDYLKQKLKEKIERGIKHD